MLGLPFCSWLTNLLVTIAWCVDPTFLIYELDFPSPPVQSIEIAVVMVASHVLLPIHVALP